MCVCVGGGGGVVGVIRFTFTTAGILIELGFNDNPCESFYVVSQSKGEKR